VSVDELQRTASHRSRVPQVTEVAVAGKVALIGGYPAWFLHQLIEATPGGLEATLARSRVPIDRREGVLQAWRALGEVGGRWRMAASASGTAERQPAGEALGSSGGQLLSASETAVVLGVTARYVRMLAAAGIVPGRRERCRWLFAATDVAAAQTRRTAGTDAA
jgi:hypothetical protein